MTRFSGPTSTRVSYTIRSARHNMYFLTEWEGQTGKYLARRLLTYGPRTARSPCAMTDLLFTLLFFSFKFLRQSLMSAGPDGFFRSGSRQPIWPYTRLARTVNEHFVT